MRFGIVTADQELYTTRLLYFLKTNLQKPDCIILVRRSLFTRLNGKLNLRSFVSFLKGLNSGGEFSARKPAIDHLGQFLVRQGIDVPDVSLTRACRIEGIPMIITSNIHSIKTCKLLRESELDLLINAGGGIFKPGVIGAIRIGILNAHMGLLPDMRGMNVLEWSIFYGKQIGVTLHLIDRGIDTGDILAFRRITIEKGDSISDLRDKSGIVNFELFAKALADFKTDTVNRKKQLPEMGRQYFIMHFRLRSYVERKLRELQIIN